MSVHLVARYRIIAGVQEATHLRSEVSTGATMSLAYEKHVKRIHLLVTEGSQKFG
jgi:hypothetical protein